MQEKLAKKNQSVEKIFTVIEVMASGGGPMRLQDIAAATDIPSSTALRFVNTLVSLGYAIQNPITLQYSLTLKLARIGSQIAAQISICDIARPYLLELSKRCEESCSIAEEQDMEVVCLDVVDQGNSSLKVLQRVGKRMPMHCSGTGKLLLMNRTSEQLDEYLKLKKLEMYTPNTITSYQRLIDELTLVREQGYAVDDEENELGTRCVAAPVRDYTGRIIYGIAVTGPSSRMTADKIRRIVSGLIETADKISAIFASSN